MPPSEARPSKAAKVYTALEWVGTSESPGPYFDHGSQMGQDQRDTYFRVLRLHADSVADMPMNDVGRAEAVTILNRMLVCPACKRRAEEAGRLDLTAQPGKHLLATAAPWDGRDRCVDDDGEISHYTKLQKASIQRTLGALSALWAVAVHAGSGDAEADDPRCIGITKNPFAKVKVPRFEDRPDNDDFAQALSHIQLERLERAMPAAFAASVPVKAHGLLRRSELLAMTRSMVSWPAEDDHRGQAVITIDSTWFADGLRPWGKTAASTREPIYLSALATSRLAEHVAAFRSSPSPESCTACAAGLGSQDAEPTNAHRGCSFAGNAPIWVLPESGDRPHPDSYSQMFRGACERAGLTPEAIGFWPTPKVLRATGATLLLEAGIEPELVRRMGRWTNLNTLLKHYNRLRDASKARAAAALDAQARGELGIAGGEALDPTAQVVALSRRNEALAERISMLEEQLRNTGHNPTPDIARNNKKRSVLDDDALLTQLISEGHTRGRILEIVGLSLATKNYARLDARATELGLTLPPKWTKRAS